VLRRRVPPSEARGDQHGACNRARLGDLPWLVVRGKRLAAFHALGVSASERIRAVIRDLPALPDLKRFASSPTGRNRVARTTDLTAASYPEEVAELRALAEGAQIPFETLMLLNLRGDLGDLAAGGCSDLGWRGRRTVLAHNEDGAPRLGPHCTLLTLILDKEPAITAWWYPGFLPSNSFAMTRNGLAWGIDHIPISHPQPGAGRHFVARGLQRCTNLDHAVDFLKYTPSSWRLRIHHGRSRHGPSCHRGGRRKTARGSRSQPWTRYLAHQPHPLRRRSTRANGQRVERPASICARATLHARRPACARLVCQDSDSASTYRGSARWTIGHAVQLHR
jgi:Acyl-coenzyme A:6-aminopenicillanic acid acyl-transferase